MITYNRLWQTMKEKGISQYRMIRYYGVSAGQIGRLKSNNHISTHTVDVLCRILKCGVEEIMEYKEDPGDNDYRIPNIPPASNCSSTKEQ